MHFTFSQFESLEDDEYLLFLLFYYERERSLFFYSLSDRLWCFSFFFLCYVFYYLDEELSRCLCLCYLSFFLFYFFYFFSFFYFLYFFYFYFYTGSKSSNASSLWGLSILAEGLALIYTFVLSNPRPIASGPVGYSYPYFFILIFFINSLI